MHCISILIILSLTSYTISVRVMRGFRDTIINGHVWHECAERYPTVARDLMGTVSQQRCLSSSDILGFHVKTSLVFESRKISFNCPPTTTIDTLVYDSFREQWLKSPHFAKQGRYLWVEKTSYSLGKLFLVGGGDCWRLIKFYGVDMVSPTALPPYVFTTTMVTSVSTSRSPTSSSGPVPFTTKVPASISTPVSTTVQGTSSRSPTSSSGTVLSTTKVPTSVSTSVSTAAQPTSSQPSTSSSGPVSPTTKVSTFVPTTVQPISSSSVTATSTSVPVSTSPRSSTTLTSSSSSSSSSSRPVPTTTRVPTSLSASTTSRSTSSISSSSSSSTFSTLIPVSTNPRPSTTAVLVPTTEVDSTSPVQTSHVPTTFTPVPTSRSNPSAHNPHTKLIIGSVCGTVFLLVLSLLFCYYFKVYIVPRRRINYDFVNDPIVNPVNSVNNSVNTVVNPFVIDRNHAARNDSDVEDGENVSEMTVLQTFNSVLNSVQDFNSVTSSAEVNPVLNQGFIASESENIFTDVPF